MANCGFPCTEIYTGAGVGWGKKSSAVQHRPARGQNSVYIIILSVDPQSASQWPFTYSQMVSQTEARCSGDNTFNFGTTASHCLLNLHCKQQNFKKVIIAQDVFYQKVKNQLKNINSSAYQTRTVAFLSHQICRCSVKNLESNNTHETTSRYKGKT